MVELSKEKLLWMYQKMVEIRKFDLKGTNSSRRT